MKKIQSPLERAGNRVSAQLNWYFAPNAKSFVEQEGLIWFFPVREHLAKDYVQKIFIQTLKAYVSGTVQVLEDQPTLAVAATFTTVGQRAEVVCRCTGTAAKPEITIEAKFL